MKLLNYILLSALLCVCGVAGAQELKWSDFTVSDTISLPTKLLFDWDAKRTSVTKNGIKYKYLDVRSKMISAEVRPECRTPEELSRCQTLADYSKAWALALQDSLLSVTKNSTKVATLFKERYFRGLKEGEKTGIYQFPLQPDTPFDITSINFREARTGVVLGVGVTAAMPLEDFGELVTPIKGLNLSIGGVGGLSLSGGIAYEHKLGKTTYNLEGNHSEMQNNYLRFRIYTDQIQTKTAWMPTVNASVSFMVLGRNLYREN